MGKKKKAVSQVVIAQIDEMDELKQETGNLNTYDNAIQPEETPQSTQTTEKESIKEDTPILSNIEVVATLDEVKPENDQGDDQVKPENDQGDDQVKPENEQIINDEPKPENDQGDDESKTVETTTSENSVELKEIQIKPDDDPIKTKKTNCNKGMCTIL